MSENRLQPPVTQCGSHVKVRYKSSATKGKKKYEDENKTLQSFNHRV